MRNKRLVFFYLFLAVLAVALQKLPGILESALACGVVPSGLPIYIAARFNLLTGIAVFCAASVSLACLNIGEALFFTCVSGMIGLTLAIMRDRSRHIYIIPIPSVLIVFAMLSIVNYFNGISIFGTSGYSTHISNALLFVPPLYIYCLIYLKLSMLAENLLIRNFELYIY